jgi:cytidyltransferase-like protein
VRTRSSPPLRGKRRAGVAVLGGTFDHLHAGHAALLRAAFERAMRVKVGLTTDRFARSEGKPLAEKVQSYSTRRRRLRGFLRKEFGQRRWSIVPLNDRWGGSVRPGADWLILSTETRRAGRPINAERRRRGLPPLRILVVPIVRAFDGRPIASRRIRSGEIDPAGNRPLSSPRRRSDSTKG